MELRYEEFCKDNLELVKEVQNKIFPESSFSRGFDLLIEEGPGAGGNVLQTYFVAFADGEPAGMFGLYIPNGVEEHKSIWLGWYGIMNEFRGKGIGKRILLDAFERAKEYREKYGVVYLRLFTDEVVNDTAQPLYNKIMDLKEYYRNEEMFSEELLKLACSYFPDKTDEELRAMAGNRIAIFSKRLFDDAILVPWDSYFMNFVRALSLETDTR